MTNQANSNVRLVRCPKCRHVLRELVEVPIYRCGGCGAILQAKKRGKVLQGTESQAHEADPKHMNEVQNTSRNPIAEESCLDNFPKGVDSTTDDRIEPLGEISKSSQPNGSDAITCDHETEGSSTEARTRTEEEEGEFHPYQCGAADREKDSEISASNEIFQKNEVEDTSENPITEESCIDKFPKRVDSNTDDMIVSLGKIDQSSQPNGSDAITCDHEIEGSSTEARTRTEEEEGKLHPYQCGAADQEKDFEISASNEIFQKNEFEDTFENPITEESCIDKFPKRVDSTTDDIIVSLGEIDQSSKLNGSDAITCDHETEGSSTETRTRTEEEEGKLPPYQCGAADQDKNSEISASNEIFQKSEVENTSENPITEESCIDKFPKKVDSTTDDRIESLGEIDQSSQVNGSDAITCDHEIEDSSTEARECTEDEEGKLPLYQYGAANQDKESKNNALNDILQKNEVESNSENSITEESCTDKFPRRVDSTTDDRIESLGEINKSSQLYSSDTISCHEIEGSATEARAHTGEEEGKLPSYQYGAVDQDQESKYSASNEILSFSKLNQHEINSLVPEVHNHESESFLSSLETETQSPHSSSECNCEKEVSENDLGNATEKSSAQIETERTGSSEDNCAGSKKEFENELQNTSENPSTDIEDLEKVHAGGKNSADGRSEWIANLSLESINPSEADKCEISFNQSGTEANYESGDNEKSGDVSIRNKVLSSPKLNHLENDSSLLGYHMYGSGKSLVSSPKQVAGGGHSSPRNDNEGKNEYPSQVEELDEKTENLSVLASTNAEPLLDTAIIDQIFTAKSFSSEGISSDNLLSPHREMQQIESRMATGFRHVSSDDTLESTSHLAKGDLGVTLKSSTSRSYYAYDDSTSSNETDNEVPHRRLQLLKRSLKNVDSNSTKVLPERSKFTMNHVTSNELQRQLINSRSSSHGKKHSTTKVSRWHQDELLQRARYRSPVRYTMRNEADDYHSRPLVSTYSSQAHQENRSSTNYGQIDFSALPDNPQELHRLELLRMVYELQDQLKRTHISELKPHESILTRPSKGKEHHFAENRRNYSNFASHNYHEKYRRDLTWLKYRELPQMVVPKNPTHYMHRVDCSCLRCYSQEQHHSAQLPSHAIYYSDEHPMTNARQTSRPHHSASSSRDHYETSEFSLRSQDMKPDNQWDNKHKEARIHQVAKRHFQPIAGGAPIVACYHCSETLLLPAESFLFRRRCHQLKCGACSEVLKFSLENKIHVVRYDLIPRNPPLSKIAENTSVIKKSNLALAYRENDRPLSEPETSADNSQSFSRSYSTGDNFSVTPRNYSSASSSKAPKESTRKSVYRNRSSVESFKSARSIMPDSEHSCSESEVESPLPGSALHKLMGYSSIRRLVFQ